jgi:hypothetical protein
MPEAARLNATMDKISFNVPPYFDLIIIQLSKCSALWQPLRIVERPTRPSAGITLPAASIQHTLLGLASYLRQFVVLLLGHVRFWSWAFCVNLTFNAGSEIWPATGTRNEVPFAIGRIDDPQIPLMSRN